jgi:hypothetical protein
MNIIDTSLWIEFFAGTPLDETIVNALSNNDELYVPTICLKVNFAMKRCLVIGRLVQELPDQRYILGFKRIAPCAEQIEGLAVHKENSFLRFVDYKLGSGIEILNGRFPYKGGVIAFVFYNLKYVCHCLSSLIGGIKTFQANIVFRQ